MTWLYIIGGLIGAAWAAYDIAKEQERGAS